MPKLEVYYNNMRYYNIIVLSPYVRTYGRFERHVQSSKEIVMFCDKRVVALGILVVEIIYE